MLQMNLEQCIWKYICDIFIIILIHSVSGIQR